MSWITEAEAFMPDIFKAGATNTDGMAIEEILHHIMVADRGRGVSEQKITQFASARVPFHSILRIIEIMERSGQIDCIGRDKLTGLRYFKAASQPTTPLN